MWTAVSKLEVVPRNFPTHVKVHLKLCNGLESGLKNVDVGLQACSGLDVGLQTMLCQCRTRDSRLFAKGFQEVLNVGLEA